MRRKIELYLGIRQNDDSLVWYLADIATDALVLMNYKQTDATAPAAVFNSWSQSVVLPRTSRNNAIFDHIFRADHVTNSGKFNALARTPFVIYSDKGEILESGYLKLTDMNEAQYNATLYGGLGGFLFGLMYNSDGSKRSLADLVYTSGGDEHEFDFAITRDAVREAWRHLAGLETHANPWDYINFAPCYNGLPGGDFNSKRAFCPVNGVYGVTGSDGNGHTSRRGHVMVDLVNNVDEWAANDLRSYQQRPVLSFKGFIDAICQAANNGGYTVNLDANFFKSANPYYQKAWLTLPKIDSIQLPNDSGSGTDVVTSPDAGAQPSYSETSIYDKALSGDWIDKGFNAKHDVNVTFKPTISMTDLNLNRVTSWETPDQPSGRLYYRIVALYQLLAYDSDGNIIGGSKVAAASCATKCSDGATPMESTITPANFVSKYNNALSTHWNTFTPAWTPEDGDTYEAAMVNGAYFANPQGSTSFKTLRDSGGNELTVTLQMNGVAGMAALKIRTTYLAIRSDGGVGTPYYQAELTQVPVYSSVSGLSTFDFVAFVSGGVSYSYSISGTAHSGAQMTKALLLGGTQTPADYLLSYLKTFGLYMTYNPATKAVGIMTRSSFYNGGSVDLEGRIDVTTRKSQPFALTSRWYEWASPVSGRFADYYRDVYNKEYGMARVNTGFEFDASHNDVLKDCAFKGAAEVLHRNKYFVRVTQDGGDVPSPFLDGGKYTLWGADNSAVQLDVICPDDTAVINYMNTDFKGYDTELLPKAEFCDKDGKAVDGADVLLLYDGSKAPGTYGRYTLTDDNGLMTLYNEGAPCWLLGQSTILANLKYRINGGDDVTTRLYLPRFRRMMTGDPLPLVVTHSLDMEIPQEIDQPRITAAADKAVYSRGWAAYITDKMNVDTKVVTCKVDLRGFQVGQDLLRKFYYFDGCVWVLNQIKNYVIGGDDLTECEFIKVNDKTNYTNGQTY